MAGVLYRLGRLCAHRPLVVVAVWLGLVVVVRLLVWGVGAETSNDLSLPGTESQQATDLLASRFPPQQNGSSPVVFYAPRGKVTDQANKQAVEASYKALVKAPHVASAPDPFANAASGLVSKDATTAFTPVLLDIPNGDVTEELAGAILDTTAPARKAGLEVSIGGNLGGVLSKSPTESSEVVGLIAAMVILALTFGSLVAMGMPIVTAVLGLATALGLIGLLGHLLAIPTVGPTLATMIGLGVGIDYALFLVTKHRDQMARGIERHESIARAVATSGGAIVFAGGTVVIALLSLWVAGIPLVASLGYASAVAVFTAVLAAVTLLPAMLSLAGRHLFGAKLPAFLRPRARPGAATLWSRWAATVTAHPLVCGLVALALLAPLIVPMFSLHLGQEDIGATPRSTTERQAFDVMAARYGPGYNGPLLTATELRPPARPSQEYEDKYNQAKANQADLERKQKTLTAKSNSLKAQQASLERQQAQLEAEKRQLQQEQSQLLAQQAVLRRQAAQLQAQRAALQRQLAPLQRQEAQLQAQRRQLEQRRAQLRRQAAALPPAIRANLRAQAALTAHLARDRLRVRVLTRVVDRVCRVAPETTRCQDARRALAAAQADLSSTQQALAAKKAQLQSLRRQAVTLAREAAQLRRRAAALARQAARLARQAAPLLRQARALAAQGAALRRQANALAAQGAALRRQADQLAAQADVLQKQAASLQKQADALKKQQQQAEEEKKQTEQLKQELTDMLTKAGGDDRGTDPRLVKLQDALATPAGVQLVSPPSVNKGGDAATFTVIPRTRPADPKTADLVTQVRSSVIPAATGEGGITAYVGGVTAANVDLASKISSKLAELILVVLALSIVLLLVAFRSLLIPVQAAVTNLLCVGAAFGILVATFQWGWGLGLVGLSTPYGTVPIASYVPLMMFAALFGLSMDYEVFLVSQIAQHHAAGEPPGQAVRSGVASSAKVIAAAAIIMISVFGSFILNGDPTIKQFGVGLSVAVLLASAMVLSLAPAMLTLFGKAVWWLPGWLSRVLPHVDIEGESEQPAPEPAAEPHRDGAPAAGRPMPRTGPWPAPPAPVHEPAAPGDGDGRAGRVPDD
jgi:uncharacterized membrane protein YdfJ with MMPL/SSD domain